MQHIGLIELKSFSLSLSLSPSLSAFAVSAQNGLCVTIWSRRFAGPRS